MLNDAIFFSGEKPKLKKIKLKISKTGIFVTSKIKKKKNISISISDVRFFFGAFLLGKKTKNKTNIEVVRPIKIERGTEAFQRVLQPIFCGYFFFFFVTRDIDDVYQLRYMCEHLKRPKKKKKK